jgi:glutamine phosphoribosylpyrophosphate amidotransferase
MLKDSGANEVHVRIASPEFMFPSFYGIPIYSQISSGDLLADINSAVVDTSIP